MVETAPSPRAAPAPSLSHLCRFRSNQDIYSQENRSDARFRVASGSH